MSDYAAFARLYDLFYGGVTDDVSMYRGFAERTGGRVLEIGVGTGRVAIPLAQAGCAVTGIDVDEMDLVRVGVRAGRQHLGDDDAVETLTQPVELLDSHAEVAELLADLDGIAVDRREVLEPGEKGLHRYR